MVELANSVSSLNGVEISITATVGDRFLDEIIEGYSTARIYNSSVKVTVLGGSPQVFKPAMPFKLYVRIADNFKSFEFIFKKFSLFLKFLFSDGCFVPRFIPTSRSSFTI